MVCGFYFGWTMTDIPGITPTKLRYFSWHKWIGVTVFALAVIRVLWRVRHKAPSMPRRISAWQRGTAHLVHFLLYALMIMIPMSGYLYSSTAGIQVVYLGIVPLPTIIGPNPALKVTPGFVQIYLNYTLLALVALHLMAVLKHQFVDHDSLIARMIPFLR
jgi:cytochrome b561